MILPGDILGERFAKAGEYGIFYWLRRSTGGYQSLTIEKATFHVHTVTKNGLVHIVVLPTCSPYIAISGMILTHVSPNELTLDAGRFAFFCEETFDHRFEMKMARLDGEELLDWIGEQAKGRWSIVKESPIPHDPEANLLQNWEAAKVSISPKLMITFEDPVDAIHFKLRWS